MSNLWEGEGDMVDSVIDVSGQGALVQCPLHSNGWCRLPAWPFVKPSLSVLQVHSFLEKKYKRLVKGRGLC